MSIVDKLIASGFSPATLLRATYDRLDEALDGVDIVDTTSPFAVLVDAGAYMTSACFTRQEVGLRKLYRPLAKTYDDLYRHMASADYIGRFSGYSEAPFFLYLKKDEIESKAVKVGDTGIRKLLIPRHTQIKVDATIFTLLFPIEIRIMPHGGYQVVFDNQVETPIAQLESNYIDWKFIEIQREKYLMMNLRLPQLLRTVYTDTLNPSSVFRKEYNLNDLFFHCRIFGKDANGNKFEFETTHSEEVYNVRVPSAVLTLLDSTLRVDIPRVYFSEGQISGEVEIVIYTTKGDISQNFANYELNRFSLEFGKDYNSPDDSKYAAPFSTWTSMGLGSSGITTGGSNGMSLEELTQIVIDGATHIKTPITFQQLQAKLKLNGYDIINSVENVMQRIYLATRHLPAVSDSGFASGASASIETLTITLDRLVQEPTVVDNGERITLSPDTVYRHNEAGVLEVVPVAMLPDEDQADSVVADVNSKDYMFSPFYYVLDTTKSRFQARAYHLDSPVISSRRFIAENETTQLGVSTDGFLLNKVDGGYELIVTTVAGETYQAQDPAKLFAQLSFIPKNETGRATISGIPVGITEQNNIVWKFPLETNFDIDDKDILSLLGFSMYANQYRPYGTELEAEFEIIYGIQDYSVFGMLPSSIDNQIADYLMEGTPTGITHEAVTLKFGESLNRLWANVRTVPGAERFQVYTEDIPKVWAKTEVVSDENGPIVTIVNGVPQYEIIHRKGDPVLDSEGNVEYAHRKGEPIMVDGELVPLLGRDTERMIDLMLIDGNYRFCTHPRDLAYRDTIAATIARFAKDDMEAFVPMLHEKTWLYFYPKKTMGRVPVIVGDGLVTEINAALSFTVRYYMERSKYTDLQLREAISQKTKQVINLALQKSTVSRDYIQTQLKSAMGNDVVAVDMDNFGSDKSIPTFTAVDDSARCAVGRRLRVLPDNSIIVEEAITVDFIPHKA